VDGGVYIGKLSRVVQAIRRFTLKTVEIDPIRKLVNWGRLYSLWPVHVTTSCCSVALGAGMGARFDYERFGVLPFGSLRQNDLIIIEGTLTYKFAKRIRRIYDQMPEPKYVIAIGTCALSGGIFRDAYSIVKDVSKVVPVDVFVPGCPPRPEGLGRAVMLLQEKIRRAKVGGEPIETPIVVR